MEQENFDAKLMKLSHEIEQLDAKIDDKISSLREELREEILRSHLSAVGNISLAWLRPISSEARRRAYDEIAKLTQEYHEIVSKVSADECLKNLTRLNEDVNRITRAAGLGELWKAPKS